MIEARAVEFPERIDLELTRVVDEQREWTDRLGGRRDEPRYLRVIRKIGGHHRGLAATLGNLTAQPLGRGTRPMAMDCDRIARTGERARNRGADALRTAGDQGSAPKREF